MMGARRRDVRVAYPKVYDFNALCLLLGLLPAYADEQVRRHLFNTL